MSNRRLNLGLSIMRRFPFASIAPFAAAGAAFLTSSLHCAHAAGQTERVLVRVGAAVAAGQSTNGSITPGQSSEQVANAARVQAARITATIPGATVRKTLDQVGWQVVEVPAGTGATARQRLAATLGTEVVADQKRHITRTPNDTEWNQLWNLQKISAPAAWDKTTGSKDVIVAVLDTGIAQYHQDLAAALWVNSKEIPGNNRDDDGNGYVDDVNGINAMTNTGDVFDYNGHGSHVAGIIGALGNNGKGITGVNWNVKLMTLKFLDANGDGFDSDAIECINYVLAQKARGINIKVTNSSWGGPEVNPALKDAFDKLGAAGILNVCSAGNGGLDGVGDNNDVTPDYPSSFNTAAIVSVGATNSNDNRSTFSNYGATTVDLAAPGDSILSTLPGGLFGYKSGTSMAAPHVAGAAALVLAANPGLGVADLKNRLLSTVDPVPAWAGKSVSGGRLNLARAVNNSIYSVTGQVYRTWPDGTVTPLQGAQILVGGTKRTSTNHEGRYTLAELGAGTYNISASLLGFTFPTTSVALPAATGTTLPNAVLNIKGNPTASAYFTIGGKAYDLNKKPVAGVTIYFKSLPDVPAAITDSNGSYLIRARVPQTYNLFATGLGSTWKTTQSPIVLPASTGTNRPNGTCDFYQQPLDTAAPTVKINTPANGATLNSATVTASGTMADATGISRLSFLLARNVGGVIQYYDWMNKVWTTDSSAAGSIKIVTLSNAAATTWQLALPALTAGNYNLMAWGTDTLGNETPIGAETFSAFRVSG